MLLCIVLKFVVFLLQLLFGFYDHGCTKECSRGPKKVKVNFPGWALKNYLAFLSIRWKIDTVQFFCYREDRGKPDLKLSLIGEASFPSLDGIHIIDVIKTVFLSLSHFYF
jgi:hypothetical protein